MSADDISPDDSVHGLTPEQARTRWSLTDQYVGDIRDLRGRMEVIEKRLRQGNRRFEKYDQALFDPVNGVVMRIHSIETEQTDQSRDMREIKIAICGEGNDSNPGIIRKMDFVMTATKVAMLIGGAAVTTLTGIAIYALFRGGSVVG